jgi:hypothetical protein
MDPMGPMDPMDEMIESFLTAYHVIDLVNEFVLDTPGIGCRPDASTGTREFYNLFRRFVSGKELDEIETTLPCERILCEVLQMTCPNVVVTHDTIYGLSLWM